MSSNEYGTMIVNTLTSSFRYLLHGAVHTASGQYIHCSYQVECKAVTRELLTDWHTDLLTDMLVYLPDQFHNNMLISLQNVNRLLYTYVFTCLILSIYSLTHLWTLSFTHSITYSFTLSLTRPFTHALNRSITHPMMYLLSHSFTYSLPPSLLQSITQSINHSLTSPREGSFI